MTLTREVDLDVTAVRCLSLRGFLADTKTNHLLHSGNNKVRHLLSWDKHARKLTKFSTADLIGLLLLLFCSRTLALFIFSLDFYFVCRLFAEDVMIPCIVIIDSCQASAMLPAGAGFVPTSGNIDLINSTVSNSGVKGRSYRQKIFTRRTDCVTLYVPLTQPGV